MGCKIRLTWDGLLHHFSNIGFGKRGIAALSKNLGEISELKMGLDSLFVFVTGYQKVSRITKKSLPFMEDFVKYYQDAQKILKDLKQTPSTLGVKNG